MILHGISSDFRGCLLHILTRLHDKREFSQLFCLGKNRMAGALAGNLHQGVPWKCKWFVMRILQIEITDSDHAQCLACATVVVDWFPLATASSHFWLSAAASVKSPLVKAWQNPFNSTF